MSLDTISQIKALYSSLIEGIIPKAEEILERIVGEQCIIDVDWDTFTNSKNELLALQTLEGNVFNNIIRAMHASIDILVARPIYDIKIANEKKKRIAINNRCLDYFGIFELGAEGCFKEEEIAQILGGKQTHAEMVINSKKENREEEVRAYRLKRKSTIGRLKEEFSGIIKAELAQDDAEQEATKDFRIDNPLELDVERQNKAERLRKEIREKEKEVEVEEQQEGDISLILMMKAQLEIMKNLLLEEEMEKDITTSSALWDFETQKDLGIQDPHDFSLHVEEEPQRVFHSLKTSSSDCTYFGATDNPSSQAMFMDDREVYKQGYLTKRGEGYKSWV